MVNMYFHEKLNFLVSEKNGTKTFLIYKCMRTSKILGANNLQKKNTELHMPLDYTRSNVGTFKVQT